jgi:hypothetical protein
LPFRISALLPRAAPAFAHENQFGQKSTGHRVGANWRSGEGGEANVDHQRAKVGSACDAPPAWFAG